MFQHCKKHFNRVSKCQKSERERERDRERGRERRRREHINEGVWTHISMCMYVFLLVQTSLYSNMI